MWRTLPCDVTWLYGDRDAFVRADLLMSPAVIEQTNKSRQHGKINKTSRTDWLL
jgi:hypothetical protein